MANPLPVFFGERNLLYRFFLCRFLFLRRAESFFIRFRVFYYTTLKYRRFVNRTAYLVGKTLTALISAALQHLSACRRSHSLTEAVYFTSLSFLGLIGSFHDLSPKFVFFFSLFLYVGFFPPYRFLSATCSIITQTGEVRQAIFSVFSFFPFQFAKILRFFRLFTVLYCSFLRVKSNTDIVFR